MQRRLRLGDLVKVSSKTKVYDSNPMIYGFHRASWIDPDTMGVVTHIQERYVRVLSGSTEIWVEDCLLELLSDTG